MASVAELEADLELVRLAIKARVESGGVVSYSRAGTQVINSSLPDLLQAKRELGLEIKAARNAVRDGGAFVKGVIY
jgi:hypothetical protein